MVLRCYHEDGDSMVVVLGPCFHADLVVTELGADGGSKSAGTLLLQARAHGGSSCRFLSWWP